ncbi:lytic transglycosylase domain-containing protein [Gracilibacillus sp. YIM 98692]|uniref:lytic transglycosylase domain-containing protein n=1 Tax=Gracilibacillus sp. YIM 98692 TaxID=2663532 RepID=UPI0013D349DB|nr:lytic transglycosylase domain-containing protein [Gracilibacillus sp. YIM 98692]
MKWQLLFSALIFFLLSPVTYAEASNLSVAEIKEKITSVAIEEEVPPEILKAIAFIETDYEHFNEDGEPNISDDGVIGVMQVTPDNIDLEVDEDRLEAISIQAGTFCFISLSIFNRSRIIRKRHKDDNIFVSF